MEFFVLDFSDFLIQFLQMDFNFLSLPLLILAAR